MYLNAEYSSSLYCKLGLANKNTMIFNMNSHLIALKAMSKASHQFVEMGLQSLCTLKKTMLLGKSRDLMFA